MIEPVATQLASSGTRFAAAAGCGTQQAGGQFDPGAAPEQAAVPMEEEEILTEAEEMEEETLTEVEETMEVEILTEEVMMEEAILMVEEMTVAMATTAVVTVMMEGEIVMMVVTVTAMEMMGVMEMMEEMVMMTEEMVMMTEEMEMMIVIVTGMMIAMVTEMMRPCRRASYHSSSSSGAAKARIKTARNVKQADPPPSHPMMFVISFNFSCSGVSTGSLMRLALIFPH